MGHDPLCHRSNPDAWDMHCQCDFIAKVRADESRHIDDDRREYYLRGREQATHEAVQAALNTAVSEISRLHGSLDHAGCNSEEEHQSLLRAEDAVRRLLNQTSLSGPGSVGSIGMPEPPTGVAPAGEDYGAHYIHVLSEGQSRSLGRSEGREQAIRDCIAAVKEKRSAHQRGSQHYSGNCHRCKGFESSIAALRALLDGPR